MNQPVHHNLDLRKNPVAEEANEEAGEGEANNDGQCQQDGDEAAATTEATGNWEYQPAVATEFPSTDEADWQDSGNFGDAGDFGDAGVFASTARVSSS